MTHYRRGGLPSKIYRLIREAAEAGTRQRPRPQSPSRAAVGLVRMAGSRPASANSLPPFLIIIGMAKGVEVIHPEKRLRQPAA